MKFSKLYIPTLKEAPKDATLPSHQFLLRAGFIQQTGSGLYNFLPLGKRVLKKIENIVRDEMDKAGANEVSMSFVVPSELWKQSGRFFKFGSELLRLNDRKGNDFVLGPTHEESIVDMVRGRVNSYKQLPLNLYQIGLKFRDEARPRFGLLRCREFIMKDSYSFHSSYDDLKREFDLMQKTYSKIFTRLGLNFRCVEADSGAIGGSGSKEFMVLADNGEDDILISDSSDYAANVEAAKRAKRTCNAERPQSNGMLKFHTPDCSTIAAVSEFFKIDPFYTIKAVIKKAIYEDRSEIVIFFLRGDDELQETKALNACGALELCDADLDEIQNAGLVAGYCGPIGLPEGVNFYIDNELDGESEMICGANQKDYHAIGVSIINFNKDRFKDLVAVKAGDKALDGGTLSMTKGIEVGHIFQLGDKYSSAMDATFLDENGKAKPFIMGCYGIGVSRLEAVVIESSHDERGCVWKKECAPFSVHIIVSNFKDEVQAKFALELESALESVGIEVLLDDRDERFGVKIADFELIGNPFGVVVGKGLANDEVELIIRDGLIKEKVASSEILGKLKELV
ncbi:MULTISPECIES: proline--tRNA ligase [Campylobacter]|uniref:Proline--tRNA ligase n=1 Tax=Campylobacter vicugnae TaxID=1660076 RepID=A0ABZ2E5P8_9BACT|nr:MULTISPECIES: proline--tRNA ligase [unclassified Campylobacter]MCR8690230.1 proline--tRNA ligase [Campylobacter sp. RM9264]MCR8700665.1 proline--tRNA ligase [Campylobacter sp. RM12176]